MIFLQKWFHLLADVSPLRVNQTSVWHTLQDFLHKNSVVFFFSLKKKMVGISLNKCVSVYYFIQILCFKIATTFKMKIWSYHFTPSTKKIFLLIHLPKFTFDFFLKNIFPNWIILISLYIHGWLRPISNLDRCEHPWVSQDE